MYRVDLISKMEMCAVPSLICIALSLSRIKATISNGSLGHTSRFC